MKLQREDLIHILIGMAIGLLLVITLAVFEIGSPDLEDRALREREVAALEKIAESTNSYSEEFQNLNSKIKRWEEAK